MSSVFDSYKMKFFLLWLTTSFVIGQVISQRLKKKQPPVQVKYETIQGDEKSCPQICYSEIYCHGELLHDVQMARIYQDSKTFVDKKLLFPEIVILRKYAELKNKEGTPSPQQLEKFVNDNFVDENLTNWKPPDFKDIPKVANKIRDKTFKKWAIDVNKIWLYLGAKIPQEVQENPDMHSLVYMPEGFIKSGGRFREQYYWDSYWIVRGLLLSGMFKTAKGIITNMIYLVKLNGHMPNGNRKYYMKRSQLPLLIQMVSTYYHQTRDDNFLLECLPHLEKEFKWWYDNRIIEVKKNDKIYKLARYNDVACSPRPEAYYEDFLLSMNLTTDEEKRRLFTGLKSAAESGWDFSSRHIKNKDGTNKNPKLLDISTQSMIYVELNAILLANTVVLGKWFKKFGDEKKAKFYDDISDDFLNGMEHILWNEEVGVWLDYDHELGKSRNYFYVSNLSPLWAYAFFKHLPNAALRVKRVIKYLVTEGIITNKTVPKYYGIPASNIKTGEKWDFPNIWAPLQAIAIHGLHRSGNTEARQIALNFVKVWLRTMYEGFQACNFMFDRYSATELGVPGEGGEYEAQKGFGWTNGYLFEIFDIWGLKLLSKDVLTEKVKPGSIKCPK